MSVLKPAQQTRSARLLAILIQTFKDFPRGNTMLQAYVEGVGVDGAFLATRGTSGFEGLRLLAREFLCVQGQKRLSFALSSWQRRLKRLLVSLR